MNQRLMLEGFNEVWRVLEDGYAPQLQGKIRDVVDDVVVELTVSGEINDNPLVEEAFHKLLERLEEVK